MSTVTARSASGASLALVSLLAASCVLETHSVSLDAPARSAPAAAGETSPLVAIGRFSDDRGEPSHWIGAVRGPLGNPLHTLEGNEPVTDLVAAAFGEGLRARGLLADLSGAPYLLSGSVRDLRGNRYVRSEARTEIHVALTERASGRQLFAHSYRAVNEKGGALTIGGETSGAVEELRELVARTLRQVVDDALDDPAFRDSLRAGC